MSLPERELKSEEESSICEDTLGGGGVRRGSGRNVQHEFGTGAAICRDRPRDDGEDQGTGTKSRENEAEGLKLKAQSKNL